MANHTGLRILALSSVAALALAACGQKEQPAPPADAASSAEQPAATPAVDYAAIVADPRRPEADRDDDARRAPATALEFIRIAPGVAVFEIEAGSGYYTEMMSHAVGPDGSVVMQNPQGFRSFLGDKIDARLADGRLANVRESYSNFDALEAENESVDLVTWVQGPHELYFTPEGRSLGDAATSYAEIFRIVKPGGAYVVIDHSAVAGAPQSTGNDLHRIDRAIVVTMAEAAGFTLAGESGFLANPDDTRTIGVFDPSIRGHTDQFALRFVKPE